MEEERASWDRRYSESSHGPPEPDPFLLHAYQEFVEPLFPHAGSALDAAGGTGRHAIWLAQHGWRVTLLDISEIGIAKARQRAGDLARHIEFRAEDLKEFSARGEQYDLVVVFFYLQREVFPELVMALKPGGLLIYKTYTREGPRFGKGPTHPMYLLDKNELLHAFPGLQVLHYQETIRERGVAEFVGRKN